MSELNIWYHDDGTFAGTPAAVCSDIESIIAAQNSFGLKININKCEISALGANAEQTENILLVDYLLS